jgi:hypothetical protein
MSSQGALGDAPASDSAAASTGSTQLVETLAEADTADAGGDPAASDG